MNNRLNIVLFIAFIALTIFALVNFIAFGTNYKLLNVVLLLLVANIVFIQITGFILNKKTVSGIGKLGFNNLKPGQLKGLEKVKTIIFSKEKIISTGKFKLKNIEHRFTVSKKSVLETAIHLAKLWKPAYAKALEKNLKEPLKATNYQSIEKSGYGISATNDSGQKLMLGIYPYVHQYISKDDDATIYLIKNNIFSGKFTIREKWKKENIEQIKNLNNLGNLVYLDSAPEDENAPSLPVDKAYAGLTIDEQKKIIKKLSNKATTAMITTNMALIGIAGFDFLLTDKEDDSTNCIRLKTSELHKIKKLFDLIKKVHAQSGYALYILLLADISAFILIYFTGFFG